MVTGIVPPLRRSAEAPAYEIAFETLRSAPVPAASRHSVTVASLPKATMTRATPSPATGAGADGVAGWTGCSAGAAGAGGVTAAGSTGAVAGGTVTGAGAGAGGGVPADFMKPLSVAAATTTRSSGPTFRRQVVENTAEVVSPALANNSKLVKPRVRRRPSSDWLAECSVITATGLRVTGPWSCRFAWSDPVVDERPLKKTR